MTGNNGTIQGNSGTIAPSLSRATSTRNQPPAQKSLTRRVSFNEAQLKQSRNLDPETAGQSQHHHGKFGTRCNMCCAIVSMSIGTLIIILLIVGVIFFAFLQSYLPEFRVQRLDVHNINTTNSKNRETLLTAEFEFRVNTTNKNNKVVLSYGPMYVDVIANDMKLGGMNIDGFEQNPQSGKDLKVLVEVSNAPVNEDDAKELMENSKQHTMVVSLKFKGRITFVINGSKMSSMPFKVSCQDIEQQVIDQGLGPQCNVKITPFTS